MFRPFLPGGFAYGSAYGIPCSFSGGRHPAGLFVLYHIGAVLVNRFRQNFGGICLFPAPGGCPRVGGDCSGVAGSAGVGGALRGACLVCRLPTLPLVFVFPPIPPAPFPGGEGGDQGYFHARGFAPCIPGAGWDTALALLVENRFLRLRMECWHPPGGGNPDCKKPLPLCICMAGFISAASDSVQGCRGRSPRRNKL